ncbi:MAG: stress response translation initiation inhibitor YciH [Cellvibrionales bacterium]|jgi:translation initiation factor 1|nr:stress response translation initiation inhibitor YciH [Cellvibrionales bacterium]MBK8675393.1 stress response translation initiation inhibitor YciH [Cellvibrionales bacterium]TXH49507.1 MAG: stress response translation initiation inhibitor YciH [Cellvibrionales bacterium]HRF87595.1 stress response translation initiation inhibitor YciH [Pseudomonadales bacterium]HRG50408.1 stress response translation initiation inhibitor YciH [Pseudomonadales bacterium]
MSKKDSKLVYSTDAGRIKSIDPLPTLPPKGDGFIRIRRETAGRNGKGVTTLTGFELPAAELQILAKQLKQLCGTGGTVKEWTIEIQGDQRENLKAELEKRGFKVKLAGG